MHSKKHILVLLFLLLIFEKGFGQDSLAVKVADTIVSSNSKDLFNPLSPSKAAFYSAVLPGLGQAYNKSYWKIPIVYGALGTGIYFYSTNNTNYKRARTAYKLRINDKPDEFDGENGNPFLSVDALIAAQKGYKKDRDLSLLVTVGLYILQILEASTNAHLLQHNVDNNLTISPQIIKDTTTNKTIVGAGLNFKF